MKRLCIVLALAFTPMASVYAADWFVATNGTGGGTNWADATNSIQGAINASSAADTVWVSNGVYEVGGTNGYPAGTVLTNRVAIYKAITVRSADNEPANTIIKGYWGSPVHYSNAVRCVYMTNGASLIGFTLTNGATLSNQSANADDRYGGGVWSQSTNTVISNCVLTGNAGVTYGGGAYRGTLFNCTLSTNLTRYATAGLSHGGGAYYATLYNCTLTRNWAEQQGGGVYGGILYNCTVSSNSAATYAGGVFNATLYNCTLIGNSAAGGGGGGAYGSTLYNCTVSGNSAGGGGGGGVKTGYLINSIVYFNSTSGSGSNWNAVVAFTNTCTAPAAPSGPGNIAFDPLFVNRGAGNYRLNEGSPARNAGTNFSCYRHVY
ncbi:MAG: hypothetical protein HYV36_00310 [Lentisphaerae bacterium]|nr:hypothetical protein [Lentisphaerota bacterium]